MDHGRDTGNTGRHGHTTWQGHSTHCRRARDSELVTREAGSKYEQKSARRTSRRRNQRLREKRDNTILSRDSVVKESKAGVEQEMAALGLARASTVRGPVRSVESMLTERG